MIAGSHDRAGLGIISATSPASLPADTPAQYSPTNMPTAAAVMVAAVATPVRRLRPRGVTVPRAWWGMSPPPGGDMVVEGGVPRLIQGTGVDALSPRSLVCLRPRPQENKTTENGPFTDLPAPCCQRGHYYIFREALHFSPA